MTIAFSPPDAGPAGIRTRTRTRTHTHIHIHIHPMKNADAPFTR